MSKNNIDNVFQLVRFNQLEDLKKIVDITNVNIFINKYEQNLLHEAISSGNLDVLKYLLECNIDVNKADEEGKTPLHYTSLYNNYEAAKLLLESNLIQKDKKDIHGNNPIWTATFNARGNYEIVKLLKQFGANPDSKNNSNRSALDFARQIEDKELELILEI